MINKCNCIINFPIEIRNEKLVENIFNVVVQCLCLFEDFVSKAARVCYNKRKH